MISSVTWSERFEYLSSFLKYIFRHKIGKFLLFLSTNLYTVLPLSDYYSIFKAEEKDNWARSFKSCGNWPILQIKIEKET